MDHHLRCHCLPISLPFTFLPTHPSSPKQNSLRILVASLLKFNMLNIKSIVKIFSSLRSGFGEACTVLQLDIEVYPVLRMRTENMTPFFLASLIKIRLYFVCIVT